MPSRLRPADIWRQHVDVVLGVVRDALVLLHSEATQADTALRRDMSGLTELDLNREFYFRLRRANSARLMNDPATALCHAPVPEAANPPSADDPVADAREKKIPDFQVVWWDELEPDPDRAERIFAIECKRLGLPVRPDWVFNDNYVLNGMVRFVSETHLYGRDSADGAMVGYVQSQDYGTVLAHVNATAELSDLPALELAGECDQNASTYGLNHLLRRARGHDPFMLHHLWVDLRQRPIDPEPDADG